MRSGPRAKGPPVESDQAKIARLELELSRTEEELDILGKALAFSHVGPTGKRLPLRSSGEGGSWVPGGLRGPTLLCAWWGYSANGANRMAATRAPY